MSPRFVFSQDKSSLDYYNDLLGNYRTYQILTGQFINKKSRHLTYRNVDTQAELLDSSKNLIFSEIEAISSYANFVRAVLAESTRVISYDENLAYIKLDDEFSYLVLQKDNVKKLSSLSEVGSFWKDLSNHFTKIKMMAYQTKSLIEIGSAKKIEANVKVERDKLSDYLDTLIITQGIVDPKVYAAKERFKGYETELTNVSSLLNKAYSYEKTFTTENPVGVSNQITQNIQEAQRKMSIVVSGYKNIVYSLK